MPIINTNKKTNLAKFRHPKNYRLISTNMSTIDLSYAFVQ